MHEVTIHEVDYTSDWLAYSGPRLAATKEVFELRRSR